MNTDTLTFYFIPLEISEKQTNIANKLETSIPTKHVISLHLIHDKNNINYQIWFYSSMPHNLVGSNRPGLEVLFTKDLSCIYKDGSIVVWVSR
jgi:GTPase SAR1 family protein